MDRWHPLETPQPLHLPRKLRRPRRQRSSQSPPKRNPAALFIEWKNDGTNPGSLESQFKRLSQSLETSSPAWLPGTIVSEARRYYLVQVPTPWDEANLTASGASATLAVASERSENFVIRSYLDETLPADANCWLGGKKEAAGWAWVTGEAWSFATWKTGFPIEAPAATALAYQAGTNGGWINADPSKPLAAYLLEWSTDGDNVQSSTAPGSGNDLSELRTLGKKLHTQATASYAEALKKAAKDVDWECNLWLRGLAKSEQDAFGASLTDLLATIPPDGLIPANYPRLGVPPKVISIWDHYIKKQELSKAQRDSELESLRRSYVQKLQTTLEQLTAAGLVDRAKEFQTEIAAVGQTATSFDQRFSR